MINLEFLTNNIIIFLIIYFVVLYSILVIWFLIRKQTRLKVISERKRYTMEFCLNDKLNYNNLIQNGIYSEDYKFQEKREDSDILKDLNNVFNNFDKISIAVNNGVFDEEIIRTYYEKYFIIYYENFRYSILRARDTFDNPYMFIEYEKMVSFWYEVRRNVNGGKI
ncbi:DUF4760 domain-containing protein [Peribacillus frigoritolerans]|uniref:DUF4760 domain-containing protein n=1 Tax=Peribacillus frigoritolerans TaxID=450367 RepID=UPI00387135FC